MKDQLKTKRTLAVAVVVAVLIILLGTLIVGWTIARNSSSCPPEYATGFNLEGGTWCTPKSEFCEMLRTTINADGSEDDEAAYRQICAEFVELEE
jgi:hypothetical protein